MTILTAINMKYTILYFLISLLSIYCFSQRPPIDFNSLNHWPSVEDAKISRDGKYALYFIRSAQLDNKDTRTLVLTATDAHWKCEMHNIASDAQFTGDSKRAIFYGAEDSLEIIDLGSSSTQYIAHVKSFGLPLKGDGKWLAYHLNSVSNELRLSNTSTDQEISFNQVAEYKFNNQGTYLIIQTKRNSDSQMTISCLDLNNNRVDKIWVGQQAGNIVFDADGKQLAFRSDSSDGKIVKRSLWHYILGAANAHIVSGNLYPKIDSDYLIEDIAGFSQDGSDLYFSVKPKEQVLTPDTGSVKVDVWNYKDTKLQSQQLNEPTPQRSYLSVVHIQDQKVMRLEYEYDYCHERNGNCALVDQVGGDSDPGEWKWNAASRHSFVLVSTKDETRRLITQYAATLSPEGKYVIYYEPTLRSYFTYQTRSGILRNITGSVLTKWTEYDNDEPGAALAVIPLAGWTRDDATVLLYDQHDIWQVDPDAKTPPINLTRGIGRMNNIAFRLGVDYHGSPISATQKLLLTALNRKTKDNGFYSLTLGTGKGPKKLTMGAFIYYVPFSYVLDGGAPALKADGAEAYIVRRMSANESPNYFFTTDFNAFQAISNIHPEGSYNWINSQLVTWKTMNGTFSQGVLYKPENFDPQRKYPMIIYYYERLSDQLHMYIKPNVSDGPINIPWFVSNGYIVFTPDIHYRTGEIGASALNSIVSAAVYLSHMPFIDKKHIGIQGHSFGGYETNYLVTHTRIFAAAMSAAGVSDLISHNGSLWGSGSGQMSFYETGGGRMSATLWQRPDLYIKNSPIFNVGQVTTPILLMNNKKDGSVPFAQGLEFFTALRRLGKKAWMLQYDIGEHRIDDPKACEDYTIRLTQFFDHFLKGSPAPKWMTVGVPARNKGIDTGLELDK
jgi:dipeptidyl aminopeptidase/acylaminoacyl peptidase